MSAQDVVFLSGVRTAFGTFGGALKKFSAIELGGSCCMENEAGPSAFSSLRIAMVCSVS